MDEKRKIGTTGYCMGGPIVMRTASAVSERIGAGASFHGGGLVTKAPDSPHLLVPTMRAQFLFCIAENDDQREPDSKTILKETFAKGGLPAEIEVMPARPTAGALLTRPSTTRPRPRRHGADCWCCSVRR